MFKAAFLGFFLLRLELFFFFFSSPVFRPTLTVGEWVFTVLGCRRWNWKVPAALTEDL